MNNRLEDKMADMYNYQPLPLPLSISCKEEYIKNIPPHLNINGGEKLYTTNGTLICNNYQRIVVGDYGAYIEFDSPATQLYIEKGQEYRLEERYNHIKYVWLTIPDGSNVKIYHQRHTVAYADYKVGKYYVSVYEVI